MQFSAKSNNSVWFTEWIENKIGYVKANQLLPIDIEVDKENVTLRRGDSTEIKVDVNITNNASVNGNNLLTMEDSATVKENRYLKIYLAVDIKKKKKVLSIKVSNEKIHDGNQLKHLVNDVIIKNNRILETLFADGSYDSNENFRYLSLNGITPAIKVRKNARCRKTNYYLRNLSVIAQKDDFDKWKDSVSYEGKRWIAETVSPCIKRRFGEYVSVIKFENMVKEIILKISLYNWFSTIV